MTFGEIVLYSGIGLGIFSIIALILGNVIFSVVKGSVKKKLTDRYGF